MTAAAGRASRPGQPANADADRYGDQPGTGERDRPSPVERDRGAGDLAGPAAGHHRKRIDPPPRGPADGEGQVPGLTQADGGIGGWSAGDVAYLLESGFTPDFDSVGGAMASVSRNYEAVPDADRRAIGAYLVTLPPAASAN